MAFAAAFYLGCYPSILHFRIVNEQVDTQAMLEAFKNRIGITSSEVNMTSSLTLTIRDWRFQKEAIINQLAIQASPEIGTLVAATNESISAAIRRTDLPSALELMEQYNKCRPVLSSVGIQSAFMASRQSAFH